MKIVEFGIILMLFVVLVYAASPPKKVVFVDVVAPNNLLFHGTIYDDNSFEGFGLSKSANGNPKIVRLWDMSYANNNDEKYVQLCVGDTMDDSYCASFNYIEGISRQTVDWIGGQGEFLINVRSFG
ncbi:hypothetical protein HY989_02460 [Candidatus Micrarchaeota archaeon]|nr:hypothetical protein [Candidatus Micrarchaeota archaeon]